MPEDSAKFTYDGRDYDIAGLAADEYIMKVIASTGTFYEADLLRTISYLPFQPGLFLDVGANIGNHSLYFAGELQHDVVAFEMDERNFRLLRRNVDRNGLTSRVRCVHAAIGDREGVAFFQRAPLNSGGSTQVAESQEHDGKVIQLPLDAIRLPDKVSCIKIDVEGGEEAVLRGAVKTISRDKPILIIETRDGPGFHRIWRQLMPYEYHPVMVGALTETFVFCHRAIVSQCNDIMSIYHSRRLQLLSNSRTEGKLVDELAWSRELSRIKKLMTQLILGNYEIRKELRAARKTMDEALFRGSRWESAASGMSAKINDAIEGKIKLRPVRITQVRASIEAEVLVHARKAAPAATHHYLQTDVVSGKKKPLKLYVIADGISDTLVDEVSLGFRASLRDIEVVFLSTDMEAEDRPAIVKIPDRLAALRLIAREGASSCIAIADCSMPLKMRPFSERVESVNDELAEGKVFVDLGFLLSQEGGVAAEPTSNVSSHVPADASANLTLVAPEGLGFLADFLDEEVMKNIPAEAALAVAARRAGIRLTQIRANQLSAQRISPAVIRPIAEAIQSCGIEGPVETGRVDVALIGRLSPERWQRGGIYHSNRSYLGILQEAGISHLALEIDQDIRALARTASTAKIVFIYTGDQGAQDYFNVEPLVRHFDACGKTVVVNLSYDGHPERTRDIVNLLSQTSNRVHLMVFSAAVAEDLAIAPYRHRLAVVPKTIRTVNPRALGFSESRGVFLGDLGKFLNPRITRDAEAVYGTILAALPGEPIHFVSQYKHSFSIPEWMTGYSVHDYDPNLIDHLCDARVYVHAQNYCTFEMLPVESMLAGLPVVFVDMPQSLNEYIGSAGIKFSSTTELSDGLQRLYGQESFWNLLSRMGQDRRHLFTPMATTLALQRTLVPLLAAGIKPGNSQK